MLRSLLDSAPEGEEYDEATNAFGHLSVDHNHEVRINEKSGVCLIMLEYSSFAITDAPQVFIYWRRATVGMIHNNKRMAYGMVTSMISYQKSRVFD
jgi:hypothetical protein